MQTISKSGISSTSRHSDFGGINSKFKRQPRVSKSRWLFSLILLSVFASQAAYAVKAIEMVKTSVGPLTGISVGGHDYEAIDDALVSDYVITNTGDQLLAGPMTLVDTAASLAICPNLTTIGNLDGNLDVGEVIVCRSAHFTELVDLTNGSFTGTGTATIDGTNSTAASPGSDTTTLTVEPLALVITGVGPDNDYDEIGDGLSYTYTVSNWSGAAMTGPLTVVALKTSLAAPVGVDCTGLPGNTLAVGASYSCVTNVYATVAVDVTNLMVNNSAAATMVGSSISSAIRGKTLYFAEPDLPGALATLESIPAGSLVIPMDNALQATGADFNLFAYGLANKFLQAGIPLKWAIRADKIKIQSDTTSGGPDVNDTNRNFITDGVEVGDLVTNADDAFKWARVTGVAATALTVSGSASFGNGDNYFVDRHDFTVNSTVVQPAAGATGDIPFAGGPFIVSSADPQDIIDATAIIATFNAGAASGAPVIVYETNAAVNVDVRYTLTHRPFMAISDVKTEIHVAVMDAAGIPGATGGKDNYTNCGTPDEPSTWDPDTCNWTVLDPVNLQSLSCATLHMEPHRDKPAGLANIERIQDAVEAFTRTGGNFFAQCHSIQYLENSDEANPTFGRFLSTLGILKAGLKQNPMDFTNAAMPFSQITGPLDGAQGGSIPDFTLNGGTGKNKAHTDAIATAPNSDVIKAASGKIRGGRNSGGNFFYLGGHEYKDNNLSSINGKRMALNAVFVPADRPFDCQLDFNEAELTLIKTVTNDHGGTAAVADWALTATGPTAGVTGVTGDDEITLAVVTPGDYTLTELGSGAGASGYAAGNWVCTGTADTDTTDGVLTLGANESAVCTINNDDIAPKLTLVKTVTNNSGGNAVAANFPSFVDGNPQAWGTPTDVTANVLHTASETPQTGYTASVWGGDCAADGTITLLVGDDKTCTITNTDVAPTITLTKEVIGGSALPDAFGITVGGVGVTSGATNNYNSNQAYAINEAGLAGYAFTSPITGDAKCPAALAGTVTLDEGENVSCTITNTKLTARVTLRKQWVTGVKDDTALLSISGAIGGSDNDTSTSNGGDETDNTNTATLVYDTGDTVTLTETLGGPGPGAIGDYTTTFACTGNGGTNPTYTPGAITATLVVDHTATAVVCTYTNTLNTANLTLRKNWIPGFAGNTADLTISGLNGTPTNQSVAPSGTLLDNVKTVTLKGLVGEKITFSEVLGGNGIYTTGFACTNQANAPVEVTATSHTLVLVEADMDKNIVCTYGNTLNTATLTLRKNWVGGVAGDTADLTVVGANGSPTNQSTATGSNQLDTTDTVVLTVLEGETVTMNEVLGGTGSYTTTFACTSAANGPGSLNDTTKTLLIGAADTAVTCTFTNTIDTANVTLRKAWIDGFAGDMADLDITGIGGNNGDTSTASGAAGLETDTVNTAVLTALVGETIDLDELLPGTNDETYTTSFSCSGASNSAAYTTGARTAKLTIAPADKGQDIVCTYTNRVVTSGITLQKSWIGGRAGDTAGLEISCTGGEGLVGDQNTSTASGGDQTDLTNVASVPVVFSGGTCTLTETLGGAPQTGQYLTGFSCVGNNNAPTYTPLARTATLVINPADTAITCTYSNTINTREIVLRKIWTTGVLTDTADLNATGTNGPQVATSVASGVNAQTDNTNIATLTALVGETVNLSEALAGNIGSYSTSFGCTSGIPTYTPGATSATLAIDAGMPATVTCGFANALNTATVTLQKTWVNAVAADTAALTATGASGTQQDTSAATGAAGSETDIVNTAVLNVNVGETINLSEIVGGLGDYNTTFACNSTNLPGYTPGDRAATLVIDAKDQAGVTCTYTNTRRPAIIDLSKVVSIQPVLQPDGTYTVVYTVTAANTGGYGIYDIDDLFSPAVGVSLTFAPTAAYQAGTENSQTGVLGPYQKFVTGEGLAGGRNERWVVTANFTIDPAKTDPLTLACATQQSAENTGFYNYVDGSATDPDLTNNWACPDVPPPAVNLAKTVNGPATDNGDGTWTVVYTITATSTGGPGAYDVIDTFSPGAGITLSATTAPTIVYLAGTENNQSGTLAPAPLANGGTWVTDEALGAGKNEAWTVTAVFDVDPAVAVPATNVCNVGDGGAINTGFYNRVIGSDTDRDLSDNDACTDLLPPVINLAKTVTGAPAMETDGTFTVVYTVVATNSGKGPGVYNLVDTFSPAPGVTVNVDATTPALAYAGGETQTGTLTAPPLANGGTWVTGEALLAGKSESWTITANFTIDPAKTDPVTNKCAVTGSAINTGFYNLIEGSDTDPDLTDNDACADVPEPSINLAKTVNGPAVDNGDGTFSVEYTITATNSTNGPGVYNIVDTFTPGVGITLIEDASSATIAYATGPGVSGTVVTPFTSGATAVTGATIAGGVVETWIVKANFMIDPLLITVEGANCRATSAEGLKTGFANGVTGSDTDTDLTDNFACTELPIIDLAKTAGTAQLQPDGTYRVIYTVTATNLGLADGIYDIDDAFDPATSLTLNVDGAVPTPSITYGGGESTDGVIGLYPALVKGESLAAGASEKWFVAAFFDIDLTADLTLAMTCDSVDPVAKEGFYNFVSGSRTDNNLDNNDACTDLPPPEINLAKTANGPAVDNGDGTFSVEYTVTATNGTSGPGTYDIIDTFTPGVGITLIEDANSATIAYGTGAGVSGTVTSPFTSGATAVLGATIAGGATETWIVKANFAITAVDITAPGSDCDPTNAGGENTGFTNGVTGSDSDSDLTDNTACVPLPIIDLSKTAAIAVGQPDGTYKVLYTVTATNLGEAAGIYDIDDAFAPAIGLTLVVDAAVPTPSIAYGGGESTDGTIGLYPMLVTGESLAVGATETWIISALFDVDPTEDLTDAKSCDEANPVTGKGFYNAVSGSRTDNNPDNNDACTNLPEPKINLAKTAAPAVDVGNNNWEVTYTVTATNTGGGLGLYDITDLLSPGDGITLLEDATSPAIVYGGGETQTGTITPPPLANGGTWVTDEVLAGFSSETWTITATFSVDLVVLVQNPGNADCILTSAETGTGYYNYVDGSATDTDLTDNVACVPHILPSLAVPTVSQWAMLLMALLMIATAGMYLRPARVRRNR